MGSLPKEVETEVLPFYRVYKDGSVERLQGSTPYVPPRLDDPITGVSSKDITISENPLIRARLHLPNVHLKTTEKLPVLVYFHGGGFCIESAFSHTEHQLMTSLTAEAQCLAISIDYRLAPEYPLPAAYEDCWYGLQWVGSHLLSPQDQKPGFKSDPWVVQHADFNHLFIGGDSAGANIAHNTVMRAATDELPGRVNILGMFITHPYFWGSKPVGSEKQAKSEDELADTLWHEVHPSAPDGIDNPFINPFAEKAPSLGTLPCKKLLVAVAKEDVLVNRGIFYYETVKKSGWKGEVELIEVEGEGHAFHIVDYDTDNAKTMIKRLATFLSTQHQEMESSPKEVVTEVLPFYRVYKDGSIERLQGSTPYVPPHINDPITGVSSKDITISENPRIRARLHLPNAYLKSTEKLPVLVYFHGGGFCIESAFSQTEHQFLTSLIAEAQCLAVSVDYRLAPENPLPAAYEDCWHGLQWVVSHSLTGKDGQPGLEPDSWITEHADFDRLFIGGDSAGANLAHNIVMRAATEELSCEVKILGMFITHPYFWGSKAVGFEKQEELEKELAHTLWHEVYPSVQDGIDNPFINPFAEKAPSLATLPCKKLLVAVAKEDVLVDRGIFYYETVKKSGWKGHVELIEVEGEGHAFHIVNYETNSAKTMIKRLATFLSK